MMASTGRYFDAVAPEASHGISTADMDIICMTLEQFDAPACLLDGRGRVLHSNQGASASLLGQLPQDELLAAVTESCLDVVPSHLGLDQDGGEVWSLIPLSELLPHKSTTLPCPEAYCIAVLHRISGLQRS